MPSSSSDSTLELSIVGRFPSADMDRLVAASQPLDALREPRRVIVDLSRLRNISAPGIAVLVCSLRNVDARGVVEAGSMIIAPHDQQVAARIQEFGFLASLSEDHAASFSPKPENGSRPCRVFSATDKPGEIATDLTDAIAEVCQTDTVSRSTTWFTLNEIAQNVVDHASSPGGAVAIAETESGGTELEVAIVDRGVGVRTSLAANPDYRELSSDLEALRAALRAGVTGRTDKPGGLGLFFTRVLLQANGGILVVRSGTARVATGAVYEEEFNLVAMRGTLVTFSFRTDRPFSLEPLLQVAGELR